MEFMDALVDGFVEAQVALEKKQTNFDKIHKKIPEEMAEFMAKLVDCADCPAKMQGCSVSEESCIGTWVHWLRKEAEE